MGGALALPEIVGFDDVDTSILLLRMRGGGLAQLDNTRRTGHGYDERVSLLGVDGVVESGSQTSRGVTLWQGDRCIQPGLYPDWFSRVEGSYYQHLDAFVRSLRGKTYRTCRGCWTVCRHRLSLKPPLIHCNMGNLLTLNNWRKQSPVCSQAYRAVPRYRRSSLNTTPICRRTSSITRRLFSTGLRGRIGEFVKPCPTHRAKCSA